MKTSIQSLIFLLTFFFFGISPALSQTVSLQSNFVGEYDYQNVPATITFGKYTIQYKFKKPFLVQLNTESASYEDSFENKFDYTYLGLSVGTYIKLFYDVYGEFGYSFQTAVKRVFNKNTNFLTSPTISGLGGNIGSKEDVEPNRHILFASINYEKEIYQGLGLVMGWGIQSVLNPYPRDSYFALNNQTNQINYTRAYSSGISTYYLIHVGLSYHFK